MSASQSLDYTRLFMLNDPLASRPFRLTTREESDWLSLEQANALLRGEMVLHAPLRLGAYMGGQAADFLWSDLARMVVISRRLAELFTEHGFRGWATYPVEVYDRRGELLQGYAGLTITGRAGRQNLSRSQLVTKAPPAPGGTPIKSTRASISTRSNGMAATSSW